MESSKDIFEKRIDRIVNYIQKLREEKESLLLENKRLCETRESARFSINKLLTRLNSVLSMASGDPKCTRNG
jgi:hypothetical protein